MKILILYAKYGGGHLSAATSIKEVIEKNYKEYEVEMIDCMEYLNKTINYLTIKSYEGMAKRLPKAWGKVYKLSRKGIVAGISNGVNKMLAGKLGKLILEINPSLIISTHPFSNQMCGLLKKRKKIDMPITSILTDFKYHEQWLVNHEYIDKFFVSNEEMRQDLIKYGISENKVFAKGMPISERFKEKINKNKILSEFNLKCDIKTILFFAGGRMGLGGKSIFKYMQELFNLQEKMQIIAISGKNKKTYKKFIQITKGRENIKVLEFTNKVPELMSIADVVITKPGGITSSEALASGVPIIAINPIPGQEEENAEFLEQAGVAIWVKKRTKSSKSNCRNY